MEFENIYEDTRRAESYAKLEFPGTYYLAYRDIPVIIARHAGGTRALDFGCGTGRSTRFIKKLGYNATGIDISGDMIKKAREFDPDGDYRVIRDGELEQFTENHYDLVTSIFTFDNIPDQHFRTALLKKIASLVTDAGTIILLDSTPDIYTHEWSSFSTEMFPENKKAGSGEKVKIIMTDVEDTRPVEDIIWFSRDYEQLFDDAGLTVTASYKPLGTKEEPFQWKSETTIAPWVIYVLNKNQQ